MEENKSIEETAPAQPAFPDKEQLLNLLTQKQKKALGLLPEKYQSEKAKARNEMLRERMRKINEERRSKAKSAVKGVITAPVKPKKRKEPEPSSEESEEEEESSEESPTIQKKAKKVSSTVKALGKVEQRLTEMQRHSHLSSNPFYKFLLR